MRLMSSCSSWGRCNRAGTSADQGGVGSGRWIDSRYGQSWERCSLRMCEEIEEGEAIGNGEEDCQGESADWNEHVCYVASV